MPASVIYKLLENSALAINPKLIIIPTTTRTNLNNSVVVATANKQYKCEYDFSYEREVLAHIEQEKLKLKEIEFKRQMYEEAKRKEMEDEEKRIILQQQQVQLRLEQLQLQQSAMTQPFFGQQPPAPRLLPALNFPTPQEMQQQQQQQNHSPYQQSLPTPNPSAQPQWAQVPATYQTTTTPPQPTTPQQQTFTPFSHAHTTPADQHNVQPSRLVVRRKESKEKKEMKPKPVLPPRRQLPPRPTDPSLSPNEASALAPQH